MAATSDSANEKLGEEDFTKGVEILSAIFLLYRKETKPLPPTEQPPNYQFNQTKAIETFRRKYKKMYREGMNYLLAAIAKGNIKALYHYTTILISDPFSMKDTDSNHKRNNKFKFIKQFADLNEANIQICITEREKEIPKQAKAPLTTAEIKARATKDVMNRLTKIQYELGLSYNATDVFTLGFESDLELSDEEKKFLEDVKLDKSDADLDEDAKALKLHEKRQSKRDKIAIYYFLKAANAKHVDAMICVAKCYWHGIGTGKSLMKAAEWYRRVQDYNGGHYTMFVNHINKENEPLKQKDNKPQNPDPQTKPSPNQG